MSGIFGVITKGQIDNKNIEFLARHSLQRGRGLSGIIYGSINGYKTKEGNTNILKTINNTKFNKSALLVGYSSNPVRDKKYGNPMATEEDICVIYDGILLNEGELLNELKDERSQLNSSLTILNLLDNNYKKYQNLENTLKEVFEKLEGSVTVVAIFVSLGKIILYSNIGSLYIEKTEQTIYFSSEKYSLNKIGCTNIKQILNRVVQIDISKSDKIEKLIEIPMYENFIISSSMKSLEEGKMLKYTKHNIKRCTKCILPETMPFISFDSDGVCNYCNNYKKRNVPKPKEELFALVEPYRKKEGPDCIVPFSGGRDSCYGLHLIVKELEMKPITYTYDWGMVTDIGARNISRMSSKLGTENIVVVADVARKRKNIEKNLKAWLKSPHLGMLNILTAGDKHFFRYINTIKEQTGINLNLWGINPMEVTHFKAGFLGVKPDFESKRVYMSGLYNQLKYQYLRLKAMFKSIGYFNSSIGDTLSGEYYRSFSRKEDYYHIFDYWVWDENLVNSTLEEYDWELAPDTKTTWRIGDGTAGLYNYIYYTVAGFTEHDTFRSNQIREGQITRNEAIELVTDENRPRYENIKWYLDTLNMDFKEVIKVINDIPKLYLSEQ